MNVQELKDIRCTFGADCYIEVCGGERAMQKIYDQLDPLWKLKAKALTRKLFKSVGMQSAACGHDWIKNNDGQNAVCSRCGASATVLHQSDPLGTIDVGFITWKDIWADHPSYESVLKRPDFYIGAKWR